MGLFKSDLIRSFALGFLIGTAGLAGSFIFDTPNQPQGQNQEQNRAQNQPQDHSGAPVHHQLAVR